MMTDIFGISYKDGTIGNDYCIPFETMAEAEEWLYTEEYDFRERVIVTGDDLYHWTDRETAEYILYQAEIGEKVRL